MNFNCNLYYTQHVLLNKEAFAFTPSFVPSPRFGCDNVSNSALATIFRYDHMLSIKTAINTKQLHFEIRSSNESTNKLDKIIILNYNKTAQCMKYNTKCDRNIAFKYCLIGPYKYLNDSGLCTPTVFNDTESDGINVIKSETNGLDYIAHTANGVFLYYDNEFIAPFDDDNNNSICMERDIFKCGGGFNAMEMYMLFSPMINILNML